MMFVLEERTRPGLAFRCPEEGWICTIKLAKAQRFQTREDARQCWRDHYRHCDMRVMPLDQLTRKYV